MAFTKKQKQEMVASYENWLSKSQAVFMLEYSHLTVKQVEKLRRAVREVGSEAHVVKNTLMEIAMNNQGYSVKETMTETTLTGFAYSDPAALAKVFADAVKEYDEKVYFKIGYLDKNELSVDEMQALAKLPPLPVMRAQLLGTIMAPASKLVRTINEPGSALARVIKAYSEKDAA
ncbi:MAG: 50S ribosomal protein L10 [Anaerolineaceae bacterium]|nr:50S ribosomal protein L10 [Anaerolineaceae bacterium]